MGAGMSGLSCAITLERNGISPTIFEKRSSVGDRFVNGESTFSILNRPIKDDLKYLKDTYHVYLTPTDKVEKILAIFKACNVDAWAKELKEKYVQTAYKHLEDIAVTSVRKKPMMELAEFLVQRDY